MYPADSTKNKAFEVVQTIEIKPGFLRKSFAGIWEIISLIPMEMLSSKHGCIIRLYLAHTFSCDFCFPKCVIFPLCYVIINVSTMP